MGQSPRYSDPAIVDLPAQSLFSQLTGQELVDPTRHACQSRFPVLLQLRTVLPKHLLDQSEWRLLPGLEYESHNMTAVDKLRAFRSSTSSFPSLSQSVSYCWTRGESLRFGQGRTAGWPRLPGDVLIAFTPPSTSFLG